MSVRKPAVAGSFYPVNSMHLAKIIQQCMEVACADTDTDSDLDTQPKALILPHAGYIYSGIVAAKGYRLLTKYKDMIDRVVLLGPSHRVGFLGIALPVDDEFETPLGNISVDTALLKQLEALEAVSYRSDAHLKEHSLEVHLPFLQQCLGEFELLPLVVGQATPKQVANILEHLWSLKNTLFIVSSDLSHFNPYEVAKVKDHQTMEKIIALKTNLNGDEACGCHPVNGLLLQAKQQSLHCRLLSMCNSGDTAGDKDRVVGYASFGLFE